MERAPIALGRLDALQEAVRERAHALGHRGAHLEGRAVVREVPQRDPVAVVLVLTLRPDRGRVAVPGLRGLAEVEAGRGLPGVLDLDRRASSARERLGQLDLEVGLVQPEGQLAALGVAHALDGEPDAVQCEPLGALDQGGERVAHAALHAPLGEQDLDLEVDVQQVAVALAAVRRQRVGAQRPQSLRPGRRAGPALRRGAALGSAAGARAEQRCAAEECDPIESHGVERLWAGHSSGGLMGSEGDALTATASGCLGQEVTCHLRDSVRTQQRSCARQEVDERQTRSGQQAGQGPRRCHGRSPRHVPGVCTGSSEPARTTRKMGLRCSSAQPARGTPSSGSGSLARSGCSPDGFPPA